MIACALPPAAARQRRPVDLEAADCSRHQSMWGDFEVAYATQRSTAPASVGTLDLDPNSNGGVQVQRGSGPAYMITACVSAGAATAAEAQQAADAVTLTVAGGRVRVKGPSSARMWNVQLIVEAPPNANIRATTTNGPIGFEDVSGTFVGEATNGPVSVTNVDGTVTAHAQNGPVSVRGGRGTFDVETANGPISVSLEGQQWQGRLNARAHNGPLNVNVPDGFASGVEISSSSRSPWNCRVSECRNTTRDDWDSPRTVRIGPDPVVVRISTVNGPVTINR